jgi:hypothetical protein
LLCAATSVMQILSLPNCTAFLSTQSQLESCRLLQRAYSGDIRTPIHSSSRLLPTQFPTDNDSSNISTITIQPAAYTSSHSYTSTKTLPSSITSFDVMFGESDDESNPHIGSPWDPLLSSSPSVEVDLKRRLQSSSRLTPEVEEVQPERTYARWHATDLCSC